MNERYQNNWQRRKILLSKEHQIKATTTVNNLVIKARDGRQIRLVDDRLLTDFISCSYLGLDLDKRIIDASASQRIYDCGVNFPVSRTRLKVNSFETLDNLLSQIFCSSSTIVFTSIHLANLGLFPLLGSGEMPSFPMLANGPRFIMDKRVHASTQINRALLGQFGEVIRVDFQDLDQVEAQFKRSLQNYQTPIAMSDSIVSTGGIIPVLKIIQFTEEYNGYVYIDDAHGTSIHGHSGCGYVLKCLNEEFHPRLILTVSLSKGFGCNGGAVALPTKADADFVKKFSQPYIFSNPPPLSIIESSIASARIHLSEELSTLQNRLWKNIEYFEKQIHGGTNDIKIVNHEAPSPICCIFIGDEYRAIDYSNQLMQLGYLVMTTMYPTVAKGESLLRIAFSAMHTEKAITGLCSGLQAILN